MTNDAAKEASSLRSKLRKEVFNRMLFPLLGVLLIGIGLPFYLERVKPNRWSGFRIPKTFASPEIWYAANKVMGLDLIIAGTVFAVLSLIVLAVVPKYTSLPVNWLNTLVLIVLLIVVATHSFWAVSRM